ncbi:TPA: hypothetical protein ACFNMZ_001078 [Neisseria polysaccharea]
MMIIEYFLFSINILKVSLVRNAALRLQGGIAMPPFGFSDGICVLPVWFCVGMAISRQPMPSERRLSGGTGAFCLSVWKRLGKAYVGGFVGRSGWAFCGKLRFCPLRIAAAENPVPRLETRRLAECAVRVVAAEDGGLGMVGIRRTACGGVDIRPVVGFLSVGPVFRMA